MTTVRVASVQAAPVFLDREATIDRVAELTAEAAADGASSSCFRRRSCRATPTGCGAPVRGGTPPGIVVWSTNPSRCPAPPPTVSPRSRASTACTSPSASTSATRPAARSTTRSSTSDPTGELLGCHRKLMPTGGERLAWGSGDGSTLTVFDTPFGRVGGLICWENYMPMARMAMYAQGIDILLAPTWDNSDTWVPTLRHIAKEGRCFVIGSTACQHGADVPAELPGRDDLYPGGEDDWMSKGNTSIVGPDGDVARRTADRFTGHRHRRARPRPHRRGAPPVRPRRPLRPTRRVQPPRRHPTATCRDVRTPDLSPPFTGSCARCGW